MPRSARVTGMARALGRALRHGYSPARAAAADYRARLETAWGGPPGADAETLADSPAWARDLPLTDRLYVAELTAWLRVALSTGDRALRDRETQADALTGWLTDHPPSPVAAALREAAVAWEADRDPFTDRAQQVLLTLLPTSHRHAIGLHPTPPWAARHVLERLGPRLPTTMLDPSCGTGVFLLEALRRAAAEGSPIEVSGVETSPLLAATTRLACQRAARAADSGGRGASPAPVVHCADLLCDLRPAPDGGGMLRTAHGEVALSPVPLVLGNPPWVAWDALPPGYKAKLAAGTLRDLDAFALQGFEARLGAANDEVSALFALIALAHLVAPEGRLAFLLKWNLISNESARVLRRFEVRWRADAARSAPVPFAAERLVDLRRCNPFQASVEPALFVLRRDATMGTRLPAERWVRRGSGREPAVEVEPEADYAPVRADDPEGPWAPWTAARVATRHLEGTLGCDIRHGLKHDCNGVFLLEVKGAAEAGTLRVRNRPETSRRIHVDPWQGPLEPTWIRPLLQSRHLRPFSVTGWSYVLAPVQQGALVSEEALREGSPLTWRYLDRHRAPLAARRSRVFANPPFYRLFGVGPYNDAPALVVWSGMGFRPWFAVVTDVEDPWLGRVRPLVDSSAYLIPTPHVDEARYLAGLLNSTPVRGFLDSRSSGSKRGLSRAVLSRLALPPYEAADPDHQALVRAVARATRIGPEPQEKDAVAQKEADARAVRILSR